MFGLPRSGRDRRPVEIRPRVYSRTAALTSRADERGRSGRARRAHAEVETAVQPPGHKVLGRALREVFGARGAGAERFHQALFAMP